MNFLSKMKNSFKAHPSFYYAMSIAATWAGGNSLIIGMAMAQDAGLVPFWLWTAGNTLACIVFGLLALRIPKLRNVMASKPLSILMGVMSMFLCWVQMNGIQEILSGLGVLSPTACVAIPILIATFFLVILWKDSIIRNILTDHSGWMIVYALLFITAIIAFVQTGGEYNVLPAGNDPASVKDGIWKAILLLAGPFMYPTFWKYALYNDGNEDGVAKVDMNKCFIGGGLLFGFYLLFVFALAWVQFSPALNIVKAILVILIASSTLSSCMYGMFVSFGRKVGIAASIGTIAFWQVLIPIGVMGMWTLMGSIRIYIVIASIVAALAWWAIEKKSK